MIPLYISERDLTEQFSEAKTAWRRIYLTGSDEPVYSTAMCLNLIRWKMMEIKKLLKKKSPLNDISNFEIPEKVAFDYEPNRRKKKR